MANTRARAKQVTFKSDATGGTVRNLHDKLSETVSVKDFGAVGDGVTDDSVNVFAALNDSSNKVVDGGGATYRLDSVGVITSSDITIQNATFDMSNIADQGGSPDFVFTFSGTQGTATNLTANGTTGDSVLTVADTSGFTADEYAWLSSSAIFDSATSVTLGQVVKVKSVDSSTQVTLYDDVLYDFNTADTAQLSPLTTKKNIRFINCKFIGSNANNQSALYFDKCENVTVRDCVFEYCHYSAASFSRSINVDVDNCTVNYARSTGLSYGFTVTNGCYSVRVHDGYAQDLRHYVTVGDNDGVNLFVNVSNNHVKSTKDGGIDAHPACDFMVIEGNTIEGASTDSGNHDGIIFQGLNVVISNNQITGIRRHCIFCQHLPDIGTASAVITGNSIINSGTSASTDAGIEVAADGSNITVSGVTIADNVVRGANEYGIYIYALAGNLENISITGNSVSGVTSRGILVNANPAYTIDKLTVSNNIFDGTGASEGIYLLGESTINITNGTIVGNVIDGFSFGIRAILSDSIVEANNLILNFSDPYEIATSCTNIHLSPGAYSNPTTMTASTFVMEEDDTSLIANRAATITLTLFDPTVLVGQVLTVKTIQAQAVVSATSNVVPANSATPGTAILPATAGAWAELVSDGTNWVIMKQG